MLKKLHLDPMICATVGAWLLGAVFGFAICDAIVRHEPHWFQAVTAPCIQAVEYPHAFTCLSFKDNYVCNVDGEAVTYAKDGARLP